MKKVHFKLKTSKRTFPPLHNTFYKIQKCSYKMDFYYIFNDTQHILIKGDSPTDQYLPSTLQDTRTTGQHGR